jgi:hypothetical protein
MTFLVELRNAKSAAALSHGAARGRIARGDTCVRSRRAEVPIK